MARIQVMHLPSDPGDDSPFVIVIDQVGDDPHHFAPTDLASFKNDCGARAIIVSEGALDVA
jgi:hypothetical protein